jgi:RNA polymerase sigma-70 factor (ECF subfamily)
VSLSQASFELGMMTGVVGEQHDVEFSAVRESFSTLFHREFPAVARTVFLVVHDWSRAEELTQDAFVQLFRKWNRVSSYDRPGAWVRRIAIRLAVRDSKRETRRPEVERAVTGAPPAVELDLDVTGAVRRLPPSQRAAVALFYFEDRSVTDVAEILGCSPATAKVHLHRARVTLGTLLSEEVDVVS